MSVPLPILPAETSSLYEGRISQTAFEALNGTFYGLAMFAAIVRLILQMKVHRRLYLDDYLLVFACVCLTAATVLTYDYVEALYWNERLNNNPGLYFYYLTTHVDIDAHIRKYQIFWYSSAPLLWTATFAIKFAYLAFFRRLIEHVKPLITYWRFLVGITVVSFPICILCIYVVCTQKGLKAAVCLEPVYVHRSLGVAIFNIVLDIGTDLLIVVIPIRLLWSVKIKRRQKIILGLFLSLNLFMAVTAIVRVSGLRVHNSFDDVWLYLWQQLEACVAVAMLSLTAFRSAFVVSVSRSRRERAPEPWYSSTVEAIKRRRIQRRHDAHDEESSQELPRIPAATVTSMRTFIQGGHHTDMSQTSFNGILVSNGISVSNEGPDERFPFNNPLMSKNRECG